MPTDKAFISSGNKLALALSKNENIFFINSIGDFYKIDKEKGRVLWSMSTINNLGEDKTDFFESSDIVIYDDIAFFSNLFEGTYAVNIENGILLWKLNFKSNLRPIVNMNVTFVEELKDYIKLNELWI